MKWNKHLLVITCALIFSVSGTALSQPQPPVLSVVISGTWIDLSWTPVQGATGYTLSFAPIPYTGIASIGTADMGTQTSLSGYLWVGAAYYVAIQSRDGSGLSSYSNALQVVINPSLLTGSYQVFGFNDLGMHCYDPDFSVFSILPLYNVLHAQVVQKGTTPKIIGPTVNVTYKGMADATGSINTTSIGKTNFWEYVLPLFGENPPVDEGLLGAKMPGLVNQPQLISWTGGTTNWFAASGIPITALDDNHNINTYPLMNVQALDPANSNVLSSLPVVVPVSNEMACNVCHNTGNTAASISGVKWSQNTDPTIQFRENILILHDYRNGTNLNNSRPVLCASCHYSPVLDLGHTGPVGPQVMNKTMSEATHGYHASRVTTLPPSGNACYYCHPGEITQCVRGTMATAGLSCLDCHGTMTAVGQVTRRPWADLPMCQSCHTGDAVNHLGTQIIGRTAYSNSPDTATPIVATNKRFAEQDNTLYRNSVGHNGVACESCHGSTHAEWPTSQANDNLAATSIQGHDGKITECTACHGTGLPLTTNGGPHGMHNVNSQSWINGHHSFASKQACGTCHGTTGTGTVISKAAVNRAFSAEGRNVSISKGTQIGCGLCHENVLAGGKN
ncbi:MAG: cytochrome C [Deltaproteobacteria bacterium]|nr:cytochrome C [Deltaproteobacteria bacterium]